MSNTKVFTQGSNKQGHMGYRKKFQVSPSTFLTPNITHSWSNPHNFSSTSFETSVEHQVGKGWFVSYGGSATSTFFGGAHHMSYGMEAGVGVNLISLCDK